MRRAAIAAMALAAGIGLAGGCNSTLPPYAQARLDQGKLALELGRYEEAIEQADAFLSSHRRHRQASLALYVRGMARAAIEERAAAREDLMDAMARAGDDRVGGLAAVALGDMAWNEGEVEAGESWYLQSLGLLADDEPVTLTVRSRLADLFQRRGQWQQADLHLDRIIYHAERSELGQDAMSRVRARAWSVQVGRYAEHSAARQLAARLNDAALPAWVQPVAEDGRLEYLVHVGRSETYTEALADLEAARVHVGQAIVTVTR